MRRLRHRLGSRRAGSATAGLRSEINVTPLVDVVLVLLIIFMVVTPLLHRGVKLELPFSEHHLRKQDTGEQLVVSVRDDGAYVETDRLEGEELDARLARELSGGKRPVHVRADRAVRYGEVRKLLERLHAAGATQLGLATTEEP